MDDKDVPAGAVVDGNRIRVDSGEPILMAMLRNGLGWTAAGNAANPRGPFCNMGVCQECKVTVAGRGSVRACLTPIKEGDIVEL